MFSTELSYTLEAAYREASTRKHAYFCVEHVLYALLFNEKAIDILEACGADILEIKSDLEGFFDNFVEKIPEETGHISHEAIDEGGPIHTPAVQ
ncbi:MAG: hypothetical protein KDD62_00070, partial [Bdellovibrionales bacterium]|nr:hypothetical protein [Bdellovibrionales bacterium]